MTSSLVRVRQMAKAKAKAMICTHIFFLHFVYFIVGEVPVPNFTQNKI